jgi:hypothetical protein
MALVNDTLGRDVVSEGDMFTAFFAVLDTRTGRLVYSNAGHEPPLLRHPDGAVEPLTEGGPMVSGFGEHNLDAFLWGEWYDETGVKKTRRPRRLGAVGKLKRLDYLSAGEFSYLKGKQTESQ